MIEENRHFWFPYVQHGTHTPTLSHTQKHTHLQAPTCVLVHMHRNTYMHIWIHTQSHTNTHSHIHIHLYTERHIHTQYTYMQTLQHIHMHTQIYIHTNIINTKKIKMFKTQLLISLFSKSSCVQFKISVMFHSYPH